MYDITFGDLNFKDQTIKIEKKITFKVLKDRVFQFGGPCSKIGISPELNIHFMNALHHIDGNHLLYNMKANIIFEFEFGNITCF